MRAAPGGVPCDHCPRTLRHGSPAHMITPLLAELPALVAALGFAGAPLAELEAAGEAHRRRRLGLPADAAADRP